MEFPHRLPIVLSPAAGSMTAARRGSVPPSVLLQGSLPISGGKHDLELIELIPLRIGPLPLRNRKKRLQPSTGGRRLRIIHCGIISLEPSSGKNRENRGQVHFSDLIRELIRT
jgi:hypothetical protein